MRIEDYGCKYFASSNILNSFLAEVRKHPVPTVEEEEALVARYKSGDEKAKDELIVRNLRFVYSLAKIYARNESEVIDYVNEGVIGLIAALRDFDSTKGYKFITYGVWFIRREMNYYLLTKRDTISHSAQVGNISKKAEMIRQRHFAEFGRVPSDEEVKELILKNYNINVNKAEDLHENGMESIDDGISEDFKVEDSSDFNDKTASINDYENVAEQEYNAYTVNEYLKVLPEKVAEIIRLKYGINEERQYSSEEIGLKLGVQPERIDKICDAAIFEMHKVYVSKKAV